MTTTTNNNNSSNPNPGNTDPSSAIASSNPNPTPNPSISTNPGHPVPTPPPPPPPPSGAPGTGASVDSPLYSMLNEAVSAGQAQAQAQAQGHPQMHNPSGAGEASALGAGAGTKRARGGEPKYYAVKAGFKPGLYDRWEDCMAQVKGYKGALFQSFATIEEANDFLAGRASKVTSAEAAVGNKFYAVQRGRQPGVYTDWAVAQDQVAGFPAPRFRRFATWAEADEFVRQGQPPEEKQQQQQPQAEAEEKQQTKPAQEEQQGLKQEQKDAEAAEPPAPREPPGMTSERPKDESGKEYPPGTGPLPRGAFDGFDPNILLNPKTGQLVYKMEQERKATKVQPKPDAEPAGMLNIYTDGSTLKNGRLGAKAGVGVYFGSGDDRNISEPLKGSRQTNQRAELTAILRALDIAPRHRDVTIFSDSQYAINCATVWCVNWQRNNWMTADRRPVENKDLIQSIVTKIDERKYLNVRTLFEWVRGHNNDEGNMAADRLARDGASMTGGVQSTADTRTSTSTSNRNNNGGGGDDKNKNKDKDKKSSITDSSGTSPSESPSTASTSAAAKKRRKERRAAERAALRAKRQSSEPTESNQSTQQTQQTQPAQPTQQAQASSDTQSSTGSRQGNQEGSIVRMVS